MIKRLEIQNFKCFERLLLDDLTRVCLLSGKNGIGKTSILEAIFLAHDMKNPDFILALHPRRGVMSTTLTPDNMWGHAFWMLDLDRSLKVDIKNSDNKKNISIELSGAKETNALPNASAAGVPDFGTDVQFSAGKDAIKSYSLGVTVKVGSAKKEKLSLYVRGEDRRFTSNLSKYSLPPAAFLGNIENSQEKDWVLGKFQGLDLAKKNEEVVEVLKILEPRLKSLSLSGIGGNLSVYADIDLPRRIPLKFLGGGIYRLFRIVVGIMSHQNGVLLVDEIENGIHYTLMPEIWRGITKAAIDSNCQLIATTHSLECVQTANTAVTSFDPDGYRLFKLADEGGETTVEAWTGGSLSEFF